MREAFCLRLMQADGMNDNLSGNPTMPPPTGTTVSDREGITSSHPYAHPAAGTGITNRHHSALPAAGMGITSSHPSAILHQERESQQPPLCPPLSRIGNNKQEPLCLLPTTTDIARQLSRLPWRYFCLYKGLSVISTDRTPPQSAWGHERG